MDLNGARVFGKWKATKARVLWLDGRLYVVHKPGASVQAFALDMPVQPVKSAGTYKGMTTEGDAVRVMGPSCSCHRDKALGQLTVEQIMAMAGEQVAV